jgi:hypothetical protein
MAGMAWIKAHPTVGTATWAASSDVLKGCTKATIEASQNIGVFFDDVKN